ncbi:MAG: hypothetical protein EPN34_03105 [Burkholderiaceae bacterium]|nr:MAG: hypothetical protein EPN34_03105 [Burkholderiaceae bacterium]
MSARSDIEHQLQINNSGAWKTLAAWPRDDDDKRSNALNAARFLYYCDQRAKFRIATCETIPKVLRELNNTTRGLWRIRRTVRMRA